MYRDVLQFMKKDSLMFNKEQFLQCVDAEDKDFFEKVIDAF